MRYPEHIVAPMRQEMVQLGFEEVRTPEAVAAAVHWNGTTLLFVNSVCGCAGGIARPGLALALENERLPDRLATTFAGMDIEATEYARGLFADYPPSSPQAVIFKDGKPVDVIQRHQIEGTNPEAFASLLVAAFDRHCGVAPRAR
jgi:putative YphP/YqiW family bacilliredoxin